MDVIYVSILCCKHCMTSEMDPSYQVYLRRATVSIWLLGVGLTHLARVIKARWILANAVSNIWLQQREVNRRTRISRPTVSGINTARYEDAQHGSEIRSQSILQHTISNTGEDWMSELVFHIELAIAGSGRTIKGYVRGSQPPSGVCKWAP